MNPDLTVGGFIKLVIEYRNLERAFSQTRRPELDEAVKRHARRIDLAARELATQYPDDEE